jgi:hypothetical protein
MAIVSSGTGCDETPFAGNLVLWAGFAFLKRTVTFFSVKQKDCFLRFAVGLNFLYLFFW